jgi:hypothetical protein
MPPKVPPLHQQSAVSGYSREQVAAFLTTPLSADQLQLIGEIATLWNSVQSRLQYFIWQVAEWVGGIGPLVTTDLNAASLVTLARNIVDNRIKNDFARECASATIDLFDELRVVRNRIVHGLPVIGLDGTVQEFSDSTARRGRGLKVSTHHVSTAELTALLDDIGLLAVAIEGVILQGNMLTHYRDSFPWTIHESLEIAMLLPISHVRERLVLLRRQHSNTDKP